jgi:hypothetical protein
MGDVERPPPTRPLNERPHAQARTHAHPDRRRRGDRRLRNLKPLPAHRWHHHVHIDIDVDQRGELACLQPGAEPRRPTAPPPPTPASQTPARVQSTPARAITQFATLYINWTWRTLAAHERKLAALSVGPARLSEQQAAAAASGDSTIAQTRVYNNGQIISITRSLTNPKQWVIVTREQTGGNSQYDGLQASYHVTLAELAQLNNSGWTVSQWLPQV